MLKSLKNNNGLMAIPIAMAVSALIVATSVYAPNIMQLSISETQKIKRKVAIKTAFNNMAVQVYRSHVMYQQDPTCASFPGSNKKKINGNWICLNSQSLCVTHPGFESGISTPQLCLTDATFAINDGIPSIEYKLENESSIKEYIALKVDSIKKILTPFINETLSFKKTKVAYANSSPQSMGVSSSSNQYFGIPNQPTIFENNNVYNVINCTGTTAAPCVRCDLANTSCLTLQIRESNAPFRTYTQRIAIFTP